jgi:hypothetical protein
MKRVPESSKLDIDLWGGGRYGFAMGRKLRVKSRRHAASQVAKPKIEPEDQNDFGLG